MTGRVPQTMAEVIRKALKEAVEAHLSGYDFKARAAMRRIAEIQRAHARAELDELCSQSFDMFGMLSEHETELLALMNRVYGPGGAP